MSFAARHARVTVTLETRSRARTREHRELMLRGGFAREYENYRPRPLKRGRSRSDAAQDVEVRRANADDIVRRHDRDASVTAFDPRVERAGADRAFAFETDRDSSVPDTTNDRAWYVAGTQVDDPGVPGAGARGAATGRGAAACTACDDADRGNERDGDAGGSKRLDAPEASGCPMGCALPSHEPVLDPIGGLDRSGDRVSGRIFDPSPTASSPCATQARAGASGILSACRETRGCCSASLARTRFARCRGRWVKDVGNARRTGLGRSLSAPRARTARSRADRGRPLPWRACRR